MPLGVAPPNPTTSVGRLRLLLGDSTYTELDPPVAGLGDYTTFSDDELEQFLLAGGDNINRAAGFAYLQWAAAAAGTSGSVRTQDLSADTRGKSAEFRELAKFYFGLADEDDANTGLNDAFFVAPTGSYGPTHWPEAAARPFGW